MANCEHSSDRWLEVPIMVKAAERKAVVSGLPGLRPSGVDRAGGREESASQPRGAQGGDFLSDV